MASAHEVRQGECLSSIAEEYGLVPDTIWDDPANAELKAIRRDPNVLLPGDVLSIPEKRTNRQSAPTEQRHRFVRRGVPAYVRLRLQDDTGPWARKRYVLEVDGIKVKEGTTNGNGQIEAPIPPGARNGRIFIDGHVLEVALGELDPLDTISGIQGRLNNLGFGCGQVDGVVGPKTQGALQAFQAAQGLHATGELDDDTRQRIGQVHGDPS